MHTVGRLYIRGHSRSFLLASWLNLRVTNPFFEFQKRHFSYNVNLCLDRLTGIQAYPRQPYTESINSYPISLLHFLAPMVFFLALKIGIEKGCSEQAIANYSVTSTNCSLPLRNKNSFNNSFADNTSRILLAAGPQDPTVHLTESFWMAVAPPICVAI